MGAGDDSQLRGVAPGGAVATTASFHRLITVVTVRPTEPDKTCLAGNGFLPEVTNNVPVHRIPERVK